VDVALLDMHHGWPNLGHDAIVYGIQNIVCDLTPVLRAAGMRVRVTSYDVRRGLRLPDAPGARHTLYVGTGGPGHLNPRLNDGVAQGSQGIKEDPAWEPQLFELFDAIRADDEAAMFAVCHTFGVVCRWLGVADAVLRVTDAPDSGIRSLALPFAFVATFTPSMMKPALPSPPSLGNNRVTWTSCSRNTFVADSALTLI
jgi:hypothetical protein